MGYSLEVSVLGLLSTWLFWEGVQCDPSKYTMNAPTAVTVPEGLCVIIPCNFTYDPDDASSTSTLYGYWYKEGSADRLSAVATNKETTPIEDYAQNRFTLSDEVAHGNCSLIINDAQKSDGQKYYFRMEKELRAKFSYQTLQPSVNVINLENPEIIFWGDLREGRPVNITCTAPGSCSLKPPHIFWKETPRKVTLRSSEMQSNGSQVYISMLDFMPSKTDNGKELTCSVTYGGGTSPVSKERTVLLNVRYAPLIQQIQVTHGNDSLKNYTAPSQIVVEKGDSVVLRCMAEGNPPASVTWAKESVNLTTDKVLKLSSVKMQDVGEYKCHAQNSEGSDTTSVQLSIAYPPLIQQIDVEVTHGNDTLINFIDASQIAVDKGDSVTLHCKAEGNPLPSVTWVKHSQFLGTSHLTNHSELTLPSVEIQDVGTYKCQAWNSNGSASKTLELSIREAFTFVDFNPAVIILVAFCLSKVLLCFFFFFFLISCSTQRKAWLRKRVTMGIKRPEAPVAPEEEK